VRFYQMVELAEGMKTAAGMKLRLWLFVRLGEG